MKTNGKPGMSPAITRRDVLRTLAMGAVGGSVLQVIPLQAAEHVHRMIAQEKAHAPGAEAGAFTLTVTAM